MTRCMELRAAASEGSRLISVNFSFLFTGYMARYNASPARTAVGEYIEIALKYGMTPTQLALAWCHQRSCVTSTIIGATSAEQLKVTVPASKSSA